VLPSRSRASRARRVSRRGFRSTFASRVGNTAMISRRVPAVMAVHSAISSRVRPHPKQYPVVESIEQTRMQGDSMGSMGDFLRRFSSARPFAYLVRLDRCDKTEQKRHRRHLLRRS
jgi:hypothetical protein